MSAPLLLLGRVTFDILPLNFQELERETVAKWASIPRFGQRAARQFTGLGDDETTINGLIFPEEFGGRARYEVIRVEQAAGRPVMMMGLASATRVRSFGQVVILSVSDTQSHIAPNGQGRVLKFSVKVSPY